MPHGTTGGTAHAGVQLPPASGTQGMSSTLICQSLLLNGRRILPFPPVLAQEQDVVVAGEGLPFDAMDEDESSEEDEDEDALLPAEEHFALPLGALDGGGAGAAAGLAAAGGGAGGVPPAGGPHAPQVQGSAAETLLRAVSRRSTRARNRLRVPLSRPAGGNILLVKLINQV